MSTRTRQADDCRPCDSERTIGGVSFEAVKVWSRSARGWDWGCRLKGTEQRIKAYFGRTRAELWRRPEGDCKAVGEERWRREWAEWREADQLAAFDAATLEEVRA